MAEDVHVSGAALREHRVVVVGAGIGGLVSALLLAHRGLRVTVVESALGPGGKMRRLDVDGAAVDSGPTVFTMRWVFDQLLAEVGSSLEVRGTLTRLAGLVLEASGLRIPVGSQCLVSMPGQPPATSCSAGSTCRARRSASMSSTTATRRKRRSVAT